MNFKLTSSFEASGNQAKAVDSLLEGLNNGEDRLTLLGVTGSGKTFTMAKVIEQLNRSALILSPNKTLAAQLYAEFKNFFPENAVEFFVSYYDYYQPEAYIPQTDTYIDKDAMINERIDRLRLSATTSLMTRRDVIVVSSISCIYGLGAPTEYSKMTLILKRGEEISRSRAIKKLVTMQYSRGEDLSRGTMRLRGEILELHPSYREDAFRIIFFGDSIESIQSISPLNGNATGEFENVTIYPAKHFVQSDDSLKSAVERIEAELNERYLELQSQKKILEAERLKQRTNYDLDMIREMGYCKGIENYARHLTGRKKGEPPYTLLDYFPEDFLVFIDESHVATGQIEGMYAGDRSRKLTLVDFGFRLPSALDNRPLKADEFYSRVKQAVFTSATPGNYELKISKRVVEQLIRPTGLVDPEIEIRPATGQVDDLLKELTLAVEKNERVLVTTLTKRTAEELAGFIEDKGFKVEYLHSEIKTMERIEKLKALRTGEIQVLVGINLLREGLDLPEVALVAILDADREGFLRSEKSLIQTMGRAARNRTGRVLLYADNITGSITRAVEETRRRRQIQLEYNERMGITPQSISKPIESLDVFSVDPLEKELIDDADLLPREAKLLLIQSLEEEMQNAAETLNFERAAYLRDKIESLKGKKTKKKWKR
ncbi:MAG: excinuclease ABC subunit B [Candidatus Hydrogenedentes bacterium CG07_land_8_20_14_0_80_42_17]|nr:MAG: excinuclease ABC subunit B [Candidatus Hydrogenedentes bacterium CG07_land_8_20_14_0_80_42_17]